MSISITCSPTVSIHDLSISPATNHVQTWHRALLQDFWTIHLAINDEICFKHMRFFTNTSTTLTIGQAHSQFVATLGQQAVLERLCWLLAVSCSGGYVLLCLIVFVISTFRGSTDTCQNSYQTVTKKTMVLMYSVLGLC